MDTYVDTYQGNLLIFIILSGCLFQCGFDLIVQPGQNETCSIQTNKRGWESWES